MSSSEKYKNLKVKELQELLQKYNLPHTGKKEELIERLVKYNEKQELASLEDEFGDLDEFDESKVNLDDIPETGKSIEDLTNTELEDIVDIKNSDTTRKEDSKKTKSSETLAINNNVVVKPNSNFKYTPITFDKGPSDTNVTKKTETSINKPVISTEKKNDKGKLMNDAEKALERAKRFGIQLNESTKKEIRAQRFGIAATSDVDDKTTIKKATKLGVDPEVLKKRAERFGVSSTATKGKVSVVADPLEEEKKRKRAERFNVNKKQKTE
ncbi:uncharacterized protein BX663DRAFT_528023 [Cokeromyces recurvatus]|uniref:uncharacterized protein n=1 Tax=Cokeromyces recurvatus TaxID=90255 RepID=UPI00221F45C2|nr:uncharacterized protein BX663DRAFT_528023 [Cokeromyces recurvatus]KAI7897537.1 hypothetical protein BX663DRAFT_528023 [Cokeromyces recurvatus]